MLMLRLTWQDMFISINILMKRTLPSFAKLTVVLLFLFFFSFVILTLTQAAPNPDNPGMAKALQVIPDNANIPVCGVPSPGKARCHSRVITNKVGEPLAGATPPSGSLGPVQLHTAYNFPCTPGGQTQSACITPQSYGPQIIGIVIAYHSPTLEQDLQTYSATFGIPGCSKASGCLSVVNQSGGNILPSTVDGGWAFEEAMDVQVAHAVCQTCKILVIEANTNSLADLAVAVNTAAGLGATAISNSYGASEWSTESAWDGYYNHPGIAVTASSGDNGYNTSYPAASKYVVAVGGTTLQLFNDNSYANETVWNGAGSGCSKYELANSWQSTLSNWSQTGCSTKRALADIAAVADPNTGVAIYDSTPYSGSTGWWQVGGTSLSSPIIAAAYALAGGMNTTTTAASLIYKNFSTTNSHDITSGSNGNCLTVMCKAALGYDGPTGLGTPNGVSGFMEGTVIPTPSPSSGPLTPTPTSTPTMPGVDTVSPSVGITFPTDGSIVTRRAYLSVIANASDNVGVTRVRFYRNGALICTRTTAPYTCSMYSASGFGTTVTYKATANDAANNIASSSISVKTQ